MINLLYYEYSTDKQKYFYVNDIEVIVDGVGMLWLNEKHIEKKLSHKPLPVTSNKYDLVDKKLKYKLVNRPKKQPNRSFLRSDLALKVIMD